MPFVDVPTNLKMYRPTIPSKMRPRLAVQPRPVVMTPRKVFFTPN